ncbi:MAG: serpin family protein [Candidatus Delongbacteria bacterium]|nr:serpin family protein [Candidatus Delongbacteria bacterium]
MMIRIGMAVVIVVLVTAVSGCSDRVRILEEELGYDSTGLRMLNPSEEKIVNASYGFGFDLLREIHQSDPAGNIIISPLSLSMALGMTLNGAKNDTRTEMIATLGLEGLTQDEINQSYGSLIRMLVTADPGVTFGIANSIWCMEGIRINSDFIHTNQDYFSAEVRVLDFYKNGSLDIMNGWVSAHTDNRITAILDQIPPNVVMVLINALYFQGVWQYQFNPEHTEDNDFRIDSSHSIRVPMMTQSNLFLHWKTDEIEILDLPYGDGHFAMMILMPSLNSSLDRIIPSINWEQWDQWKKSLQSDSGTVYLPRFKAGYRSVLNDRLSRMGMPTAFIGGQADFSGIAPNRELYISRVIHQSDIRVNEEGTTAAAATVVEISEKCSNDPWFFMSINRPFLYVIHERQTGIILFIGTITQPE